jgi:hypothetical protein
MTQRRCPYVGQRRDISAIQHSKCKGPEAGKDRACPRSGREGGVEETEDAGEGEEGKVRD